MHTVSETGAIENEYDYDIFGNPILTVETEYKNAIRYAGEFYDEETGLYYLRARYYNPYTGRFISEDSYWGEDRVPHTLNKYVYVHNDPINFFDPTGKWEQEDVELNQDAQAQIIALTNSWWEASTQEEKDRIHKEATKIREDEKNRETKYSPMKIQAEKEINSVVKKAVNYLENNKHFTQDDWEDIVGEAEISLETTQTSYGTVKQTKTVTSIGRTDLEVDLQLEVRKKKADLSINTTYNLTPYEQLFVGQTLANGGDDVNFEKAVTILDIMERDGGTISDSDLANVVGEDHFVSENEAEERSVWYNPLSWLESSTGEMLSLIYNTSMEGLTINEIDQQLRSEQIQGAFMAMSLSGASKATPSMAVYRNTAINNGTAKTWNDVKPIKPTTGVTKGTGEVKPFDIVEYGNKNKGLENHHGVMDAWAKNNIPGYVSRAKDSTTMALTEAQHAATKSIFGKWKYENYGFKGKVDWEKVSPQEIQALSERMFDAANVPASARKEYYNEFMRYIYSLE